MKRDGVLKKRIRNYLKKEQLSKGRSYAKLGEPFLKKARKNLAIARLLMQISDNEEPKRQLGLPNEFEVYEWVIIATYYAMYAAALAALARAGFKSKSHAATLAVLESVYVKGLRSLAVKDIFNLTKTYSLSEELISKIIKVKSRRETAQYDATPSISRENATVSLDDADTFITKIEAILI